MSERNEVPALSFLCFRMLNFSSLFFDCAKDALGALSPTFRRLRIQMQQFGVEQKHMNLNAGSTA